MLFYRNLISKCCIKKNCFSNVLSSSITTSELSTEIDEDLVTTFGGKKCNDENILKAEDLIKHWRSVFYPKNECGSKSYALIGSLAELETILLEYGMEHLKNTNLFTFKTVDDILPLSTTTACGINSINEDNHTIQYLLTNAKQKSTHCLSGTAEMGIAHNLRNKIFNINELPQFFASQSRCFRPEVSNKINENGLYRLEMFAVCTETQSEAVLQKIVSIQREIFSGLNIHCRLKNMHNETLNEAAFQKYDIEAWMPGRKIWGEISSASNCTDYQSQRLNIFYKDENNCSKFVHTCNGTAMATSRMLIALLETFQNPFQKRFDPPLAIKKLLGKNRSAKIRIQPSLSFIYKI